MAKRIRPGPVQNLNIRIPALTSVGRQAPSKRLVTEAENLDNVWVSVERGIEKRPSIEMVPFKESSGPNGFILPHTDGTGPFSYNWILFSESERYLIVLDLGAPRSGTNKLFWVYYLNPTSSELEDHTPDDQAIDIPADVWTYVQYNTPDPLDGLQMLNIGTDILVLNKEVYAGYTSQPLPFAPLSVTKLHNLDGTLGSTNDTTGRGIQYWTSADVDPENEGVLWTRYSNYAAGTVVYVLVDDAEGSDADVGVWKATEDITTDQAPNFAEIGWVHLRAPDQVPIESNKYPDLSKPWLGQSVPSFADIKMPPLASDVTGVYDNADITYNSDTSPSEQITALYGSAGGKIYVTEAAYLSNAPGYYQIIDDEQPYTRRIRTPDWCSVLDKRRMPMRLRYLGKDGSGVSQWEWSEIDWDPRLSGDRDTNPGPYVFDEGRQSKISAMAFYRNRLWLASRDRVIGSEEGNYDNFFLNNPAAITDSDTIDMPASWGQYVSITALRPFDSFLFINTDSDVQFLLHGVDNEKISPTTTEIKPSSFYSTSPLVSPVVLGSQIYFVAPRRMYMYIPSFDVITAPIEVSGRVPNYLPTSLRSVTIAPSQDAVIGVDEANPYHLYFYVNRFAGTEVLQSSFFRYVLPLGNEETADIRHLQAIDNQLYMVVTREQSFGEKIYLERTNLDVVRSEYPYLDRSLRITLDVGTINDALDRDDVNYHNAEYHAADDETEFLIPFADDSVTYIILGSDFEDTPNIVVPLTQDPEVDASGLFMKVRVSGDLTQDGTHIYIGRPYLMNVELSPMFYRDDNGSVLDGSLSLRTIHTRHNNTGAYDVFVYRRGRPSIDVETLSAALDAGTAQDYLSHITSFRASNKSPTLPTQLEQSSGELVGRILGYSDVTTTHIISNYPLRCNITDIEVHGVFRTRYTSHF